MSTSAVRWERDDEGIVTLTLDDPTSSANTMNDLYRESMREAVARLQAERDEIVGVIVTSAKSSFFAGGDLTFLKQVTPETAQLAYDSAETIKADLRALETLGRPVVAVLNGTALGGGLEIALACHHRIAVNAPGAVFGLPEVTLGLLPGGGGVTRTVRMMGIITAVTKVLADGARHRPSAALELGLVDALSASHVAALGSAKSWIRANPEAVQRWDVPGYRIPGGEPSAPQLAAVLPSLPALIRTQLKGAPYPAPKAILCAAVEGAQVDFDTASRIETRYLVGLLTGPVAKNMIQAYFFDMQAINRGASRPQGVRKTSASKVGVLGAGMMGAGIAYACARAGLEVVLKDVSTENAERGKSYTASVLAKAVQRGAMDEAASTAVLNRIVATADPSALAGVDVVIEAVFEDPTLKAEVFAEIEPFIDASALLCSNTSTLPITELAAGVSRAADFLGLHFFSPVDKMPLVEIIVGTETSDEALARAYDLVRLMGKTPIVVNDSRGFFTSRVIGTFVNEGLAMLGEGVLPLTLERAATQAGYPVGTLQLTDELNLQLMQKIRLASDAAAAAEGREVEPHPADRVLDTMLELGRSGRLGGAGFYAYDDTGTRTGLWEGLSVQFPVAISQPELRDIQDRFLFIEALESLRCLQEGVLRSSADANIGSLLGIGYPSWTGGVLQFVAGYPGGVAAFLQRAQELAGAYGARFAPPDILLSQAEEEIAASQPALAG